MNTRNCKSVSCIILLVLFALANSAQAQEPAKKEQPKKFSFNSNLYLWTMSLNGSAALPTGIPATPQTPVVDIDLGFSDAIQNLKMAAMMSGHFNYDKFSLLYDVDYVKLKYSKITTGKLGNYLSADMVAKTFNGDFAIGYKMPVQSSKLKLEAYAGTRITSVNNELIFHGTQDVTRSWAGSKTWVDPIVGADLIYDFSKKWFGYFKGDIGGFGAASDITWSLTGVAGYRLASNWNMSLGYKWLGIDYEKDYFIWNASQYGFLVSLGYRL